MMQDDPVMLVLEMSTLLLTLWLERASPCTQDLVGGKKIHGDDRTTWTRVRAMEG
jgi:hypothetical protein